MNTYVKFCPNVFIAKCEEQHQKGDIIPLTTKYGKENNCIVFNSLGTKDGFYFYSIVREDGYNAQERAKLKAEKYNQWSNSAENQSTQAYNRSKEIVKFIPMGQPILVGHHSENRHRSDLNKADNAMRKCVELSDKANNHSAKSEYWASKANTINLSMPESLDFFEYKLEEAKAKHEGLKNGTIERRHSFSLTYAKKELNDITKNLTLAKRLWAD